MVINLTGSKSIAAIAKLIPCLPYLFILCAEIMSLLFKNSNNIRSSNCYNQEFLISQYADDKTLLLGGSTESLRNVIKFLKNFCRNFRPLCKCRKNYGSMDWVEKRE